MIKSYVIAYLATAAAFAVIDLVWLGIIAKDFYRNALAGLMADKINIPAAIAFYLVYITGIVIFAIAPALRSGQMLDAALWGALFGFFCYATYDLTNLATLRGWPLHMSLVDMAWGTVLTGSAAVIGYLAARAAG